jgi:hypothetical protein
MEENKKDKALYNYLLNRAFRSNMCKVHKNSEQKKISAYMAVMEAEINYNFLTFDGKKFKEILKRC